MLPDREPVDQYSENAPQSNPLAGGKWSPDAPDRITPQKLIPESYNAIRKQINRNDGITGSGTQVDRDQQTENQELQHCLQQLHRKAGKIRDVIADARIDLRFGVLNGQRSMVFDAVTAAAQQAADASKSMEQREDAANCVKIRPPIQMIHLAEYQDCGKCAKQSTVEHQSGSRVEHSVEKTLDVVDRAAVSVRKPRQVDKEEQQMSAQEHPGNSKQAADKHVHFVMRALFFHQI